MVPVVAVALKVPVTVAFDEVVNVVDDEVALASVPAVVVHLSKE